MRNTRKYIVTVLSIIANHIENKRTSLLAALVVLLLASSCQKEPIIRFGFDCDFGKNSQGLTIMNVSSSAKFITLTGEVSVAEGEVLVELVNPNDEIVFSGHLVSSIVFEVNESFPAVSGNWRLKYKSIEGVGSIKLHLSLVNDCSNNLKKLKTNFP